MNQYNPNDPDPKARSRSQQANPYHQSGPPTAQPPATPGPATPTDPNGNIPPYQPPAGPIAAPHQTSGGPTGPPGPASTSPPPSFDYDAFKGHGGGWSGGTPEQLKAWLASNPYGGGVQIGGASGDKLILPNGVVIDAIGDVGGQNAYGWTQVGGPGMGGPGGGGPGSAGDFAGIAGFGFPGGGGDVGGLYTNLLRQVLTNPESLGPQVVAQLKERNKEENLGMQQQLQQRLEQDAIRRGLAGSGRTAGLERQLGEDTISRLTKGNRDVDIAAAQTNMADRLNALQAALSGQVGLGNLGLDRQRLAEQARQFNDQLGFNYGVFNYNTQMDPWRILFGGNVF